jgi:hypothetical protein
MTLITLASAVTERTTWYPLTLGWLVVIAAIGMFFGSTYLLLATNIGSRLGFLVVGAVATGFIAILAVLWMSTATPLNVFKGRTVEWKPVAVVQNVESSNIKEIRTIREEGSKLTGTEYANVKAAADTVLAPAVEGVEKPEAVANDLPSVDVIVTNIYEVGGSTPNPLLFEFTHTPQYAAAEFCQLDTEKAETAFRSTCDTSEEALGNNQVLILEKDLGSLRQPPLFLFLGSSALFGLFLLALHWREQDEKVLEAIEDDAVDTDTEKVDA